MELGKFEKAHYLQFDTALAEIKNGRKTSHWMWYIFPQIKGLGSSHVAIHFAIKNMEEANAFLHHPVLGKNLVTISSALLNLPTSNANVVFGSPDDLKLHSSMTLFSLVPDADVVFKKVLEKFFNDKEDNKTLKLLGFE